MRTRCLVQRSKFFKLNFNMDRMKISLLQIDSGVDKEANFRKGQRLMGNTELNSVFEN